MEITLGYDERSVKTGQSTKPLPVVWDSKKVQNPHIFIMGMSGTGKSYMLSKIIQQCALQSSGGIRFHIIDVHNELEIAGDSHCKFSAATEYGFNPFVINTDIHSGGIKNCIRDFIALVELGGKLGTRQQSVLRQLLLDVFAARGFFLTDSTSWFEGCNEKEKAIRDKLPESRQKTYKQYPTLEDVIRYAKYKQKAMNLGTSSKTIALLDEINKLSGQMNGLVAKRQKIHDVDDKEKVNTRLATLKEKCIESFSDYLNGIESGKELDDWKKYDNAETLSSLVTRLENLDSSGIFRNKEPQFDEKSNIWRYEVSALSLEEKKMFVDYLCKRIYRKRVDGGKKPEVCEFIVLDEAAMFFNKETEHIINVIATQARKFGLGLICASQNVGHASDDFLSSVACKIVFTLAETTWGEAQKKLHINSEILKYVKPRQNVLIKIQNGGEQIKPFVFCRTI